MAIKGKLRGTGNIKVQTLKVGVTDVNITTKSIQELQDVEASETDKGLLQYDQATDKWKTTTVIDGGTF
jgi:hypothetical protein|tara:strand:+ start:101 stop:307 length:207 start_codon:yes stop_codon:yes gene_type:complete